MLRAAFGRVSDRKLRLFGCACVRRLWPLLADVRARRAVEVAERFADGGASRVELHAAQEGAWLVAHEAARAARTPGDTEGDAPWDAARAAAWTADPDAWEAARHSSGNAGWDVPAAVRADLLRDVLHDPFRPPPAPPERGWLTWRGGTVAQLARVVYDEGRFDDLPVLADALEEAGCADAVVLGHCRRGDHARGCWVIDLLLRRE
jgi:hypothetical protein